MFSINIINYRMNNVGTPTIKGEIRKARASGYNFTKAMGDIMDGAITMTGGSKVYITISPSIGDPDKISSITVSDNIETGMSSLKYRGAKHPLCWTCDSEDHVVDSIISEFGTGLKSAAVNIGSKMVITTKYSDDTGKVYRQNIDCNWEKMVKDNTYDPTNIRDISEDEYNRLHRDYDGNPLLRGTTIELSEICDKFTGRAQNSIDELTTYIASTYHSVSRDIYLNNSKISIDIPYTNISNFEHNIYSIDIEIYDKDIIMKPIVSTHDTDSPHKKLRKVEFNVSKHKFTTSSIKDSEYKTIYQTQSKIDTCVFKATRKYGIGKKIPHKIKTWTLDNLPQGGSVNISRNGRMLTNWSKDNPRHISFGPKFHMEQHYNYFHMNYNSKQTGSLLGISYTKSIDGNFPNNKLVAALQYSHTELKKILGGSTKYAEDWQEKHKLPWNGEFSPSINSNICKHRKQWLTLFSFLRTKVIQKKRNTNTNPANMNMVMSNITAIESPGMANSRMEGDDSLTNVTTVDKVDCNIITSVDTVKVEIPQSISLDNITARVKPDKLDKSKSVSGDNIIVQDTPGREDILIDTGIQSLTQNDESIQPASLIYGPQNYLGIFGCDEIGISCTKVGFCKGKFGFTTQLAKKREGGGDYPSERFQIISVDHVTINCEPQLLEQIGRIEGVMFTTKERFTFPIEKLGEIKKVYHSIVSDNFRTPSIIVY